MDVPSGGLVTAITRLFESKSAPAIMFVAWATSGVFLSGLVPKMAALAEEHPAWFWVPFVVSSSYFVCFLLWWFGNWIGDQYAIARSRKDLKKTLEGLADYEWEVLGQFIRQNRQTLKLPSGGDGLRSLMKKRIIFSDDGPLMGEFFEGHFTVDSDVWDQVKNDIPRS